MLVDWFTVGAQVLNFLILVWLMKRYLYKPVLRAIAAREKLIAAQVADAAANRAQADQEREELTRKHEELEQQRAALMSEATKEAQAERQRLIEAARDAADAVSAKRQEALRNEAITLNEAITRRAQEEVFAIARKALADLATTSLEERLGEIFTCVLREMNGSAKEQFAQALSTMTEPAVVRSAFDLPPEQRAAIRSALDETFRAQVPVRFEVAPELVSGIELTASGQKVGWSIAEYLGSLANAVGALVALEPSPKGT